MAKLSIKTGNSTSHSSGAFVGCVVNSSTYYSCTPASFPSCRLGVILNANRNKMLSQKSGILHGISGNKGFTLIELIIVITIIGILAAIAIPNYQWSVIKAKEAVLREDLYNFRSTIDQFHADQGKYPDSLEDLKTKRYLREIPKDPFTKSSETWVFVGPPADVPAGSSGSEPASAGKIYDVHSGSNLVGSTGTAYNEW